MTRRRTAKSKLMLCLVMALFLLLGTLPNVFAAEGLTIASEDVLEEVTDTTDEANLSSEPEFEPETELSAEPGTQLEAETEPGVEPDTQLEVITAASVEPGAQAEVDTEFTEPGTDEEQPAPQTGSISGFLWIDNTDSELIDSMEQYSEIEQPLAGYAVSLYDANDRTAPVVQTQTDLDGTYIFEDLIPGNYVVGLASAVVDDNEYLLPLSKTSQNEFAIDENTDPLMAYTEVIALGDEEEVQNINASMRLSISARATATIDDIWAKKVNDPIDIDGKRWYVVKKLQNYESSGINYVLLIRQSGDLEQFNPTGDNHNDYSNSALRTHFNKEYDGYATSTIKQIAVVPSLSLSSPSSKNVFSLPTATAAGSQSKGRDIYFALSYADLYEVNGNSLAMAPLFNNLPLWVWSRTAATSTGTGNLWGVKRAAGTMDGGLSPASTNVYANPAVWVRTTPLSYEVTVHYIDTTGAPIGSPNSTSYTVAHGDPFTLDPAQIPVISNYEYIQWKVGSSGQSQDKNIPVYLASVLNDTDIYLIYSNVPDTTTLTISKVVVGSMANESTAFMFTVSLFDNSGTALDGAEFEYEITNANNITIQADTLLLNSSGEWTFSLKHGESITINGISPDGYIQVVEDPNAYYEASYIDSEDTTSTKVVNRDTTLLAMTEAHRTIAFTNERLYVPETSIADPETLQFVIAPVAATILLAATRLFRRRRLM
jgi:hypothetical protein